MPILYIRARIPSAANAKRETPGRGHDAVSVPLRATGRIIWQLPCRSWLVKGTRVPLPQNPVCPSANPSFTARRSGS
jgi:hypothetical protein